MPKSKPTPVASPPLYKNRCGKDYFLYAGQTKSGSTTYFFSMKPGPDALPAVPNGYEIYEKPNGQVFLRKPPKKLIHDTELETIRRELAKFPKCKGVILEVKKELITLHHAETDGLDSLAALYPFPRMSSAAWEVLKLQSATYTPMMRFKLLDEATRTFQTERYCFRGSIDDWIDVGYPGALEKLCQLYVRHLGQESFYELM